jgi:putative membrane protein
MDAAPTRYVAGSTGMTLLALLLATLAALLHVLIFAFESLLWTQESVWRRFAVASQSEAHTLRPMAFNQGFYNLFLAIGIAGGLALVAAGSVDAGRAVVLFACACMVGAGLVLLATNRRFARSAAIQAVPPLVAILAALLLR